jgi:hypothetical protein
MRGVGHIARMSYRVSFYRVLVQKPDRKKNHLKDQGVDRSKILKKKTFSKWDVGAWT